MNKKNVLVMAVAMLLVAMISVGGTVAWLTATSDTVKNTFTVGNITITLDEADVDDSNNDGDKTDRDTTNSYKVIPGQTIKKDPIVHVAAGSEKCYVFVKVVNTMKVGSTVVATPNIGSDWTKVGTVNDGAVYVYVGAKATNKVVDAASAVVDLTVFTEVKIAESVTKDDVTTLANKTIVIDAYAHQAAETDYDTALADALTHFKATAATSGN